MAQLRISAAARAAGKDRGTINRYIKSGRLSSSKDSAGCTVIETAELLRVFGELKGDGTVYSEDAPALPAANSSVQHILEATLELVKQQLHAAQDREVRLLALLEQEQQARREMEQRLLPPPQPTKEEAILVEPVDATEGGAEDKKSFFTRLFGG